MSDQDSAQTPDQTPGQPARPAVLRAAPPRRSHWRTIRDLLPHLWPKGERGLRLRVLAALACLLVAKAALVVVPLIYKEAIDALTALGEAKVPTEAALPIGLILAYGGARVASLGFQELREAFFAKVGQRAIRRIALQVFEHLHALSLAFHLERQTGGLSRVIERGTKAVDSLLNYALFSVLPTFIELVLTAGILWVLYGIEFAAITLVTVLGYIFYTYRITEWRLTLRRRMNESDQRANTKAIDSLLNFETVKYFGNEAHEARRYDEALRSYETAATASRTSLSILNVGQAAIVALGVTALMLLAAVRLRAGAMTVGDFVAVNAYMMQLAQPLNFFGFVYREIRQSLIDMEIMFQLLLVRATVVDRPGAPPLEPDGAEVVFDGVHFRYHPDRPILRGLSFTIPAGKTVAVVGPSGAGKSTLSRLLFRFWDVDEGAIRIDGRDLREVEQHSLRRAIGIVPQDTVLFNDSIAYNIGYGRPGASQAEIAEAARVAAIESFVESLPEGWETVVGERGLKLSGGEKQRVAIARTVLKRPCIFVFDEATSALDTKTERDILAALREVSAGRTTLVIAHRLSTVVDADRIVVLDGGRVAESGSHAELLARRGLYAEMWLRQQEATQPAVEPVEL